MDKVQGNCPMGCGETLFLGNHGYVTCSFISCPNPTAVSDILHDRETEHIVVFGETSFNVMHPLRERVNGEMLTCDFYQAMHTLNGPPIKPGRYRAIPDDSVLGFRFEELPDV